MYEKLTNEQKSKLNDFMDIYRKYLNPNNNDEIDTIIDYIIDSIVKVYLEYKKVVPYVSVEDDKYQYYILKPIDGKYDLLDYLINTAIQNLDSIVLLEDKKACNYNPLMKKILIRKNNVMSLNPSVFDTMTGKIDREKFMELLYKHMIYHEIGHVLHYKINNIEENTVYVPSDYLSLSGFPPLKKRMSQNVKKAEIERRNAIVKESAKEKIKNRISLYSVLSDKYDVLKADEIDNCEIKVETPDIKYQEIIIPPLLYLNPVEEAFTECDAQIYSGLFENNVFDLDNSGNLHCFYLTIDDEHVLMTYSPTEYAFSSSIAFALKECISKEAYFRTIFLGKKELFLDFLGAYEYFPVSSFSFQLNSANHKQMNEVQPLLDQIIDFYQSKGKSMRNLDIFFPLVYKDNKWVYYTEAMTKKQAENVKLQLKKDKN